MRDYWSNGKQQTCHHRKTQYRHNVYYVSTDADELRNDDSEYGINGQADDITETSKNFFVT